jgi:hypothetical protein
MAILGRARTAVGAGVVASVILVLAFGNQAMTEWVQNHTRATTVWGWFLRVLCWPSWGLSPRDDSNAAARDLIARDVRALLLILFTALVLGMAAKAVGGVAAFILGWASLIFGAALAAFMTLFITADPTLLGAFNAATSGASYGLFVGWIIGIAVVSAKGGD